MKIIIGFRNIYWKLDIVSCVLVQRNKTWFNKVLPKITNIWETIENETKNWIFT